MKPNALLYCQHSLGLGHFVRSLTLARALSRAFQVFFINGGPVRQGMDLPDSICFEHLPILRMEVDGSLFGQGDVDAILSARRDRMLALAQEVKPALLIVELYPFGRKIFAAELDPLIAAVCNASGKIVCSVRDILVNERVDQARHDERAARTPNRDFDAILVHADDQISNLADSFKPATPIAIPVHQTGFVSANQVLAEFDANGPTIVTAGGGIVGHALYHVAIAAQEILWAEKHWPMTIITGPLFPESDWQTLLDSAEGKKGITLLRALPSMSAHFRAAGRIVSQCGYNSALEIVQNKRPALFVPFARGQESEQTMRARQLHSLGLADWIAESELSGDGLARRLLALEPPAAAALNFDGAGNSTRILEALAS